MSDRYRFKITHTNTILDGDKKLYRTEIAERMNLMQEVVDAATNARDNAHYKLLMSETDYGILDNALKKLELPKSVEQLRDERDEAADALANYSCGIYPKGENIHLKRFKKAKAAHLAAVETQDD